MPDLDITAIDGRPVLPVESGIRVDSRRPLSHGGETCAPEERRITESERVDGETQRNIPLLVCVGLAAETVLAESDIGTRKSMNAVGDEGAVECAESGVERDGAGRRGTHAAKSREDHDVERRIAVSTPFAGKDAPLPSAEGFVGRARKNASSGPVGDDSARAFEPDGVPLDAERRRPDDASPTKIFEERLVRIVGADRTFPHDLGMRAVGRLVVGRRDEEVRKASPRDRTFDGDATAHRSADSEGIDPHMEASAPREASHGSDSAKVADAIFDGAIGFGNRRRNTPPQRPEVAFEATERKRLRRRRRRDGKRRHGGVGGTPVGAPGRETVDERELKAVETSFTKTPDKKSPPDGSTHIVRSGSSRRTGTRRSCRRTPETARGRRRPTRKEPTPTRRDIPSPEKTHAPRRSSPPFSVP
jgi:hypothetical protein